MVSFICDACQETVKKPKVDNHYKFKCRDCWVLSCVDCGVRFEGDQYKEHNTCISEAEKYQGALYQGPKAGKSNGKEDPQERWTDAVTRVAEKAAAGTISLSPEATDILQKMTAFENVPRKQKKFVNYVHNSFRVPPPVVTSIWEALQKQWSDEKIEMDKAKAEAALAKEKKQENGTDKKANKKRSRAQSTDSSSSSSSSDSDSDSDSDAEKTKSSTEEKNSKKAKKTDDKDDDKDTKSAKKKKDKKAKKDKNKDAKSSAEGASVDEPSAEPEKESNSKVTWKKEVRDALKAAKKHKMPFQDLMALLAKGKVKTPGDVKVKKYLGKHPEKFKLYPKKDAVKLILK
ncbi:Cell growth-regulating nucleolar protein [Hondaea fermentalgiana]|uniref:Cell growth-regulating nucleolar protein n=1 Tax=Hondaea fermentalgiana TaxID=2315210 RepID=A0A2R5GZM0_9STRA|nr:Cell growth-regulating nucleolar protein [Hondaea fermentalgiana]|eukprot:GBG33494.1 Cell growth-regulating nucleolar protein [Hondaea fermentalgiana]